MKSYAIRHEETLVGYFEIEADSPEEALKQYEKMSDEGLFDFSDLTFVNGKDTIHEMNENGSIGSEINIDKKELNKND